MLHAQDIPRFLWGEECMIVVYFQNRSPHMMPNNMTPKEEFTRKKPSVDHIRIFEYRVHSCTQG